MLNEICQEIRNFFDRGQPKLYGIINIRENKILNREFVDKIADGQYFRIVGSVFNDGVYCFNDDLVLQDEIFDGAIWLMAVPKDVIELSNALAEWVEKNNDALSPYTSESFGGYSYSKRSNADGGAFTWVDAFAEKLNRYRKVRSV